MQLAEESRSQVGGTRRPRPALPYRSCRTQQHGLTRCTLALAPCAVVWRRFGSCEQQRSTVELIMAAMGMVGGRSPPLGAYRPRAPAAPTRAAARTAPSVLSGRAFMLSLSLSLSLTLVRASGLVRRWQMHEGYFVGRKELIGWIQQHFQPSFQKIEDLGSGVVYCQIIDSIYPECKVMAKVKRDAKIEVDYINNFKQLQKAFSQKKIDRFIEIDKLSKKSFQTNMEFVQARPRAARDYKRWPGCAAVGTPTWLSSARHCPTRRYCPARRHCPRRLRRAPCIRTSHLAHL